MLEARGSNDEFILLVTTGPSSRPVILLQYHFTPVARWSGPLCISILNLLFSIVLQERRSLLKCNQYNDSW